MEFGAAGRSMVTQSQTPLAVLSIHSRATGWTLDDPRDGDDGAVADPDGNVVGLVHSETPPT